MRRLDSLGDGFSEQLAELLMWESASEQAITETVQEIVAAVKAEGDAAVLRYTCSLDRLDVASVSDLVDKKADLAAALQRISATDRGALEAAAERIHSFHQHQKQDSWEFLDSSGTLLGQRVSPIDHVGIYVPGGKA
ncbi:MAG: histidinol dehydrogenase, partial [Halieaceae bacterium]